jgi:integrase
VAVSDIPTVKEWFDFWFREHVAPGLKPKTLEWYRYLIGHYITPAIGDLLLNAVTGDHLIVLQNQLRRALGVRTVARVHELLNRAFKKAAVTRKIPYNPMDAVERPRVARSKQKGLAPEHAAALHDVVMGHRLELLYDLALLQGLRRGELLGLLISECDRQRGTIKVTGQVQTITGKTARQGSAKSEAGEREIPLTPRQLDMLDAHLALLTAERQRLGLEWKEHFLLFPSEKGTPIIPRNLSRHYYQAQARAHIPRYSFHALRHTAASRLDAAKATPNVRKAILGHGPGDVSESYVHPGLDDLRGALLESERAMLRWAA